MTDPTTMRLECVGLICAELASQLATAEDVLRNGAESGDVAHLVADAMSRWGWMAERAAVLAGVRGALTKGGADDWMLPPEAGLMVHVLNKGPTE